MKKIILSAMLAVITLVSNVKAASSTVTIPPNGFVNFPLLLSNSPVKITQVVVAATTATNTIVSLVDTPNYLLYTNAPYTNIYSYATNWVSTWTNYYGVTNSVTNLSLVDITNAVAGTTNAYPIRMTISALANSTVRADAVNYYFLNGAWVTNSSTGNAAVTITYQQ